MIVLLFLGFAYLALIVLLIVLTIRYLSGCFHLLNLIRNSEPELFEQLHRPDLIKILPFNPVGYFKAIICFCVWFIKGGKGAKNSITTDSALKLRKLLGITLFVFLVLAFLMAGVTLLAFSA